jgi:hypothetical protein
MFIYQQHLLAYHNRSYLISPVLAKPHMFPTVKTRLNGVIAWLRSWPLAAIAEDIHTYNVTMVGSYPRLLLEYMLSKNQHIGQRLIDTGIDIRIDFTPKDITKTHDILAKLHAHWSENAPACLQGQSATPVTCLKPNDEHITLGTNDITITFYLARPIIKPIGNLSINLSFENDYQNMRFLLPGWWGHALYNEVIASFRAKETKTPGLWEAVPLNNTIISAHHFFFILYCLKMIGQALNDGWRLSAKDYSAICVCLQGELQVIIQDEREALNLRENFQLPIESGKSFDLANALKTVFVKKYNIHVKFSAAMEFKPVIQSRDLPTDRDSDYSTEGEEAAPSAAKRKPVKKIKKIKKQPELKYRKAIVVKGDPIPPPATSWTKFFKILKKKEKKEKKIKFRKAVVVKGEPTPPPTTSWTQYFKIVKKNNRKDRKNKELKYRKAVVVPHALQATADADTREDFWITLPEFSQSDAHQNNYFSDENLIEQMKYNIVRYLSNPKAIGMSMIVDLIALAASARIPPVGMFTFMMVVMSVMARYFHSDTMMQRDFFMSQLHASLKNIELTLKNSVLSEEDKKEIISYLKDALIFAHHVSYYNDILQLNEHDFLDFHGIEQFHHWIWKKFPEQFSQAGVFINEFVSDYLNPADEKFEMHLDNLTSNALSEQLIAEFDKKKTKVIINQPKSTWFFNMQTNHKQVLVNTLEKLLKNIELSGFYQVNKTLAEISHERKNIGMIPFNNIDHLILEPLKTLLRAGIKLRQNTQDGLPKDWRDLFNVKYVLVRIDCDGLRYFIEDIIELDNLDANNIDFEELLARIKIPVLDFIHWHPDYLSARSTLINLAHELYRDTITPDAAKKVLYAVAEKLLLVLNAQFNLPNELSAIEIKDSSGVFYAFNELIDLVRQSHKSSDNLELQKKALQDEINHYQLPKNSGQQRFAHSGLR